MDLKPLEPLAFANFAQKGGVRSTVRNNGHTITVTFQGFQAFLHRGPLKVIFLLLGWAEITQLFKFCIFTPDCD
jgi:hypothetical protein